MMAERPHQDGSHGNDSRDPNQPDHPLLVHLLSQQTSYRQPQNRNNQNENGPIQNIHIRGPDDHDLRSLTTQLRRQQEEIDRFMILRQQNLPFPLFAEPSQASLSIMLEQHQQQQLLSSMTSASALQFLQNQSLAARIPSRPLAQPFDLNLSFPNAAQSALQSDIEILSQSLAQHNDEDTGQIRERDNRVALPNVPSDVISGNDAECKPKAKPTPKPKRYSPPAQDEQDDSIEKGGTILRLPCHARGMDAGHNASTAYFEVSSVAKHGQHLFCSYPTCTGVKFRFCYFCKKPVTKQNFRSRHLHAEQQLARKKQGMSVAMSVPTLYVRKGHKTDQKVGSGCGNDDVPKKPSDSKEDCPPGKKSSSRQLKKLFRNMDQAQDGEVSADTRNDDRRRIWASLLEQRPEEDGDEINSWLAKVFQASKIESGKENAREVFESQPELSEWNALFEERPVPGSGGSAMTIWIVKVLSTSCKSSIRNSSPQILKEETESQGGDKWLPNLESVDIGDSTARPAKKKIKVEKT